MQESSQEKQRKVEKKDLKELKSSFGKGLSRRGCKGRGRTMRKPKQPFQGKTLMRGGGGETERTAGGCGKGEKAQPAPASIGKKRRRTSRGERAGKESFVYRKEGVKKKLAHSRVFSGRGKKRASGNHTGEFSPRKKTSREFF